MERSSIQQRQTRPVDDHYNSYKHAVALNTASVLKEKPILKNSNTQKSTLNRIVTSLKIHIPSDCRLSVREKLSKQGDSTVSLLLWLSYDVNNTQMAHVKIIRRQSYCDLL